MDYAAAGDDAVRILGKPRQLGKAARPEWLVIGLVPNFPVFNVRVRLQIGCVVDMGCNRRDPRLPDCVRSAAVGIQIDGRVALAGAATGTGGDVVAGDVPPLLNRPPPTA